MLVCSELQTPGPLQPQRHDSPRLSPALFHVVLSRPGGWRCNALPWQVQSAIRPIGMERRTLSAEAPRLNLILDAPNPIHILHFSTRAWADDWGVEESLWATGQRDVHCGPGANVFEV